MWHLIIKNQSVWITKVVYNILWKWNIGEAYHHSLYFEGHKEDKYWFTYLLCITLVKYILYYIIVLSDGYKETARINAKWQSSLTPSCSTSVGIDIPMPKLMAMCYQIQEGICSLVVADWWRWSWSWPWIEEQSDECDD